MLSGSRRVHATNQPFRADVLQGRDILVMTIHEDRLIEDYRIPYLLDIFLRSIPLLLPIIHGLYTSEFRILIHRLDTNQATVTSIDLGNHGISQQIKRDGLIAFYTKRIGNPLIGISLEDFYKRSLSIPVFIVLQDRPLRRLPLDRLQ